MGRDLRAEGWGPEDCYPDGAYEAEERRKKIAWWQGLAEKTGWPKTGRHNTCFFIAYPVARLLKSYLQKFKNNC